MKRNIAMLLVCILALSAVLTSCGGGKGESNYLGFEGIYNSSYVPEKEEEVVYGKAEYAFALEGMTVEESFGSLLTFVKYEAVEGEAKYAVLNTKTGNVVVTLYKESAEDTTESYVEILNANGGVEFIKVVTRDYSGDNGYEYTIDIYTALGEKITTKTSNASSYVELTYLTEALYVINGKVYEVTDDVATYKFDMGLASIPSNLISTETHHYRIRSDEIIVYDLSYNLVAYYAAPSDVDMNVNVLADGNLLIQGLKVLPDDAAEYDIFVEGAKYEFTSMIFDIEDKETKTIELDFYVESILNKVTEADTFANYFVSDSLENVAAIYKIVDKSVNENDYKIVSLDNDVSILGVLGQEIEAQEGVVEPLGNDRFIATDKSGKEYLLNGKGEIIGEVSNASFNRNLGLFVYNGKYYDLDLKLVFDKAEIQYTYVDGRENYEIYADIDEGYGENNTTVTYYILNGTSLKKLQLPQNITHISTADNYFTYNYYVEDGSFDKTRYTVYCNALGEKIYSIQTSSDSYRDHRVSAYGDILMIMLETVDDNDNHSVKYYIAK